MAEAITNAWFESEPALFMSKAVKCPVCDGKGVVNGIADTGAMPTTKCHGCFGKGWVEVGGENKFDKSRYWELPTGLRNHYFDKIG